jgi:hypothetical protein
MPVGTNIIGYTRRHAKTAIRNALHDEQQPQHKNRFQTFCSRAMSCKANEASVLAAGAAKTELKNETEPQEMRQKLRKRYRGCGCGLSFGTCSLRDSIVGNNVFVGSLLGQLQHPHGVEYGAVLGADLRRVYMASSVDACLV